MATESSSRVLLVTSRAFLASEWPQIKQPLRTALQGRDSKVVFLLLDDLSPEEIDSELKHYLKVCASVKWASPGFLNKLRFFLPEPAIQTFQRSVTLRTLQPVSVISSSSPNAGDSPVGSVTTQSTSVYNQTPHQVYQVHHHPHLVHHHHHGHHNPTAGSLGTLYSQHTYQSIPEAHIYHTLDPMVATSEAVSMTTPNKPPVGAVYINKNLELILKPTTPLASNLTSSTSATGTPKHSPCKSESTQHIHSQSTLSGQQLLPNQESDEYVV